MAVMALLVSITGTALAASNAISFNTANLSINGKRIVDKGDVLESSAGAELPSIIRYTDSNGSATHYVSVRFLAEALGMDVTAREALVLPPPCGGLLKGRPEESL